MGLEWDRVSWTEDLGLEGFGRFHCVAGVLS